MQCPQCRNHISCTCVLRPASNGTSCCPNCIHAYEQQLSRAVISQQEEVARQVEEAKQQQLLQESLNNPQLPRYEEL